MQDKKVALFFTAGVTDLKFVAEDGSLLELSKDVSTGEEQASIRDVNEALQRLGLENICLLPFDEKPNSVPVKDNDFAKIAFLGPGLGDLRSCNPINMGMQEIRLRWLESGCLLMMANKMAPAWEKLTDRDVSPRALVGFRTLRDNERDEPIFVEELIYEKMRAALKRIGKNLRYAELTTYAKGSERLENEQGAVRHEVLSRIEDAVRACRAKLGCEAIEPWLATTGGVPWVKPVIRTAAELHFGPTLVVERREGGQTASFFRAPHEDLIARRYALELVRRGAFIEAAAHAWPFRDDPHAARWSYPLRGAARLFDGNPVGAFHLGAYPSDISPPKKVEPPNFLQEMATEIIETREHGQRRSLLVGLRCEAALRGGKWLEAINLTFTFYDAALKDIIECKIGRFVEERVIKLHQDFSTNIPDDLTNPIGHKEKKILEQHRSGTENWFQFWSDRETDPTLCSHLGSSMVALEKVINSLRDIRNENTHSVLSQRDIRNAQTQFVDGQIWVSDDDTGFSLLNAPIVKSLFSELGLRLNVNPLDSLTDAISRILLAPK